jgi:hypothetical protein
MLLYQKINVPDFRIKQRELINLIKNKFDKARTVSFYDPKSAEISEICPTLYSYILENSLEKIRFYRVYYTPPKGRLEPHIDGHGGYRNPISLIIPIIGYRNSLMKWWDESNANIVIENTGWNNMLVTNILNKSELNCIEQVEIDRPTFVRTDIIHSVENYNETPRAILNVRWAYNKIKGQNFEDVFKINAL